MEEEECHGHGVHQHSNEEQHRETEQPPEFDSNEKSPLSERDEQQQQQFQPSETEIAPARDDNETETDPTHAENLAGNNDQIPCFDTQSSQQVGDFKALMEEGSGTNHGVHDKEQEVPSIEPPLDVADSVVVNELQMCAAQDTSPNSPIVSENLSINEHVASIDVAPPIDAPLADSAMLTKNIPINEPLLATVDIPVSAPSAVTVDVIANVPPTEAEAAPSAVPQDELASGTADVAPELATEVANSVVSEDAPPVVAQGTPPTGDASPMIQDDDSAPKIVDSTSDARAMIQDDESAPEIDDTSGDVSPMIQDDDSAPLVVDSTTIGVDGHLSPAIDENAQAADQIAHMSEVNTKMEVEAEVETEVIGTPTSSGKRKRGRPAKSQTKALQAKAPPPKITEEEDVCFICFDGGNLVLCDRRGCPKAYHPACVNRDEAFFRSKGRWNCGWHICSNCEKGAHYMCYTCTYSLCKGCIKETEFFCVRGNKGFCETCMRTVMLIEKNEQAQVNFDDKSSWEFLFKEYWVDLKGKLALTPDELTQAKNPMKGSNSSARKAESSEELYDANDDKGSDSDSSERLEVSSSKKKKARGRPRSSKEGDLPSVTHDLAAGISLSTEADWASKELLEFVAHMRNGDKSVLTQYDVQALLLEYIKQNNLRDPRKKSQIVCDTRLENLFGKPRVAHFEMLKLLEAHFLIKEDNLADDIQRPTIEADANQLDGDGSTGASTKLSSDKRRKSRKKGDGRGPQTNLDDYAAVDVHNIKLLYLRRNLMEDLLEDSDRFHDKVVGSFVRIRISGSGAKQDMYRLVQVAGTRKAAEPYKTGKRTADVVLEIQNLNKTEVISIDTISNQEFSEDECKRLRQSIKFGLISRMTVGEVQDKAMSLQAVRVNDWLEMEKLRISHLRDRASEQGRRKDLRECVEKLELLNTPEERFRRLEEIPEVHADPNMDPNYESEEDEDEEDRSQVPTDKGIMARDAGFSRKGRDPISPGKGSPVSLDAWSGTRKSATTSVESGRNISSTSAWDKGYGANGAGESATSDARYMNSWENPKSLASATGLVVGGLVTGTSGGPVVGRHGPSSGNSQEPAAPLATPTASNISETDKMWHYKDPSGKIQGPFSMVQLRKWSTTGHFPADLRIWRTSERQEDSILLNDALAGKYTEELQTQGNRLSLPEKPGALAETNQKVNWGSSWEGNTTATWTDKNQNDRTVNSSGWEGSTNVAWTDRTQMDRANTAWTGRNINERTSNSNWNDNCGFTNGTTQLANSDVWGTNSSNWAAPTTDPKGEQPGHSFRGGWTPRGNHAWGGRSVHGPHSSSPYSGQPQRPTFHQGGQRGGRWNRDQSRGNNWNPNRYRGQQSNNWRGGYDKRTNNVGTSGPTSGGNWRTPLDNNTRGWGTVETPKSATEGWNFNQTNRNNISNLPSPTPNTNEFSWTNHASVNQWSPTPGSSFPAGAVSASNPGPQVSPVGMANPTSKTTSGWTEQQHVSATPTQGWGSAPKQAEAINQDGRVDYSSPPSPTPAAPISASNHANP